MKNLRDKIVIITGAVSSIGRARTMAMAEEGCDLVICDIYLRMVSKLWK